MRFTVCSEPLQLNHRNYARSWSQPICICASVCDVDINEVDIKIYLTEKVIFTVACGH